MSSLRVSVVEPVTDYLTLADWCARVGVSRNTFYRMDAAERPAVIRLGRRLLISKEAYADWRARMELKSKSK